MQVDAVAGNPVDTFVRSRAYATPVPFPFVVGRDLVGEVALAGPGAAGFMPGQRVWCNSLGHAGPAGILRPGARRSPPNASTRHPRDVDGELTSWRPPTRRRRPGWPCSGTGD